MRHVGRKLFLLLAAAALLLTAALAADGADNPLGLRVLQQRETITVTYLSDASAMDFTCQEPWNAGTLTWNHVAGARGYLVTVTNTEDTAEPIAHTISQNAMSLSGVLTKSGTYQFRVAALDAQGGEIDGSVAACGWTYQMPNPLPAPAIAVDGAIGTIQGGSTLVDYYEIEFYQNGEFLGNTTTRPEEPRFSMPLWVYESIEGSAPVTCCVISHTANMLEAADSPKSAAVEIGLPEKLPQVEDARILTREETHEYLDWRGEAYSITLGPGCVVWNQRDKDSHYDFAFYRVGQGGEPELIYETGLGMPYFSLEMLDADLTSGTYYAEVRETTYELGYVASDWQKTDRWTYTQAAPLKTPSNLRWKGTQAVCDLVEGADAYAFRVYYRSSQQDDFQWSNTTEKSDLPELDCRYYFEDFGNGEYYFTVSAVSNNILEAASSPYSAPSPTLDRNAQPLPTPTGFRIVTEPETVAYEFEGRPMTQTLYPGDLTWNWDEKATEYYAELYDASGQWIRGMTADVGPFLNPLDYIELENGTYRITLRARDATGVASDSETVALTYTYNPKYQLETPQVKANGMRLTITMPQGQADKVREYIVKQQITWESGEREYNWISDGPAFTVPDYSQSQYPSAQSTISVQARSNDLLQWRDSAFSASFVLCAERLSAPKNPRWITKAGDALVGSIAFEVGEMTEGAYRVTVYEEDRGEVYSISFYAGQETGETVTFDSTMEAFDAPGTYYFTLTSVPQENDSPYASSEPVTSSPFVYSVETKLEAPANPVWRDGQACWEYPASVPEGNGYQVEWRIGDSPEELRARGGLRSDNAQETSESLPTSRLETDRDQYIAFRVRAFSWNILEASHSAWVQSDTLLVPADALAVWDALDQLAYDDSTLTDVQTALGGLSNAERAWQTLGQELEQEIQRLEGRLGIEVEVQNTGETDKAARVFGLGLSAQDSTKPVTLTISRRDLLADSVQLLDGAVTAENYRSATEVCFEAENVCSPLVIPVQMMLPVPQTVQDVNRLQVLREDEPVPFSLTVENGRTYVKFAAADLTTPYLLAEPALIGAVSAEDQQVSVTLRAVSADVMAREPQLYAASYDAQGKMLDAAIQTVEQGRELYTLQLTTASGGSVQAMLLDADHVPLCAALSAQT